MYSLFDQSNSSDTVFQQLSDEWVREPVLLREWSARAEIATIRSAAIAPATGALLRLLIQLQRPQHILEIGTQWGYSTYWLAAGALPTTQITTIEKHDKHHRFAQQFFAAAGLQQIDLHWGDALQIIPQLSSRFDFIFIDADRAEYDQYLQTITPHLIPGALIVIDNALAHLVDSTRTSPTQLQALQHMNDLLHDSGHWQVVPLPSWNDLLLVQYVCQ